MGSNGGYAVTLSFLTRLKQRCPLILSTLKFLKSLMDPPCNSGSFKEAFSQTPTHSFGYDTCIIVFHRTQMIMMTLKVYVGCTGRYATTVFTNTSRSFGVQSDA